MRESKLEHVKKTERVTLKHLRSKKEYDLSTYVSARVVLKEFFSRFFLVLNWFLVGEINLHISLAQVSLLSESSRSQIDLNERESVFQSTNHERTSSGYSFERIKTGFRDEKSALNSFGIRRRERGLKRSAGKNSEYFERVFIPVNAFRAQNERPKRRKSILSRRVLRRRADVSSNSGRVFRSFAIHFIHTRTSGEVWSVPNSTSENRAGVFHRNSAQYHQCDELKTHFKIGD